MSSCLNRRGHPARRAGALEHAVPLLRAGYALFVQTLVGWFFVGLHAQQARRVTDGVYTGEQAMRGQAVYKEPMRPCHGAALEGAQGPPLAGDDLNRVWWGGSLSDLVNKIQSTMPANDPGKLTRQQSADIVAYMLQVGKFPAGQAELGVDEAGLKQITFPAQATSSRPTAAAEGRVPSFPPAANLAQLMRGILFPVRI